MTIDFDGVKSRAQKLADGMGISLNKALLDSGAGKDLFSNIAKGSIPNIEKIANLAQQLETTIDYLLNGAKVTPPQGKVINSTNEKENEQMKKLRFFENPLPLILKALRREERLSIEEFTAELNRISGYTTVFNRIDPDKYAAFENSKYDYCDIHIQSTAQIQVKDLDVAVLRAIWVYYEHNNDLISKNIFNIFTKPKYNDYVEYRRPEFASKVFGEMNEKKISVCVLAEQLCVEEISIISWLDGEREISNYWKQEIFNVLKLDKDGNPIKTVIVQPATENLTSPNPLSDKKGTTK